MKNFEVTFKMREQNEDKNAQLSREERNGRLILDAARKLFIEYHGADGVNMHQIAKAAGVGQATLYRRYSELGDICAEVVKEECKPLFRELETYLAKNEGDSPLNRLSYVINRFTDFLEEKSPWLCAISRTVMGYRPMQSLLYQWMRDTCRSLYTEALQRNELSDVDVAYTVEALLSALHDFDFHLQGQDIGMDQIRHGLRRLFIDGLKAADNTIDSK
jgi:Transcriptional regulator